jgi:hypothetical protein
VTNGLLSFLVVFVSSMLVQLLMQLSRIHTTLNEILRELRK